MFSVPLQVPAYTDHSIYPNHSVCFLFLRYPHKCFGLRSWREWSVSRVLKNGASRHIHSNVSNCNHNVLHSFGKSMDSDTHHNAIYFNAYLLEQLFCSEVRLWIYWFGYCRQHNLFDFFFGLSNLYVQLVRSCDTS